MKITGLLLAAASLAFSLSQVSAQQGGVQSYGCGVNPSGSLRVLSGGAAVGRMLTLGVDNPLGAQTPGSPAFLMLSVAPDPGYPCGTMLPGFGMASGPGELLLALSGPGSTSLGPVIWRGSGAPAVFGLALPQNPELIGLTLFFQGAIADTGSATGIGLSDALSVTIAASEQPDLVARSASVGPIPVIAGEQVTTTCVVENRGTGAAANVVVTACDQAGWCGSATIPSIQAGGEVVVRIPLLADPSRKASNPHFFAATVDPGNAITEIDETNNTAQVAKPGFVVDLKLVQPSVEDEHDDVFVVVDGVAVAHSHKSYGQNGAPSENRRIDDPEKGRPHPVTGRVEPRTSGVAPQPRVASRVAQAEAGARAGEMLSYIVKFRHGVAMPRLPDLLPSESRFSPSNTRIMEQRLGMLEAVRRARINAAAGLAQVIKGRGGRVLEYYTLAGAMLIEAPKGTLAALDASQQVQHVEARFAAELPPDSIADGRALIGTDPYYNGGATGSGFIALLDTGVMKSHDLLSSPSHIWFHEDCVLGDGDCDDNGGGYVARDNCWNHGTATAGILTGNSNLGASSRGVTSGWIDSWKVYSCGGLDTSAVLRGFDQAVYWSDKIIVAEIQSTQGSSGSIAAATDDAFDAGHCTIAANGNYGPGGGTVASPANAHKALGVGNYDVDSLASISSQGDGPTSDNRYKPDLQAPTNTRSASTASNSATQVFGGTSGATPYAAGAASVFADWFSLSSISASPGKIYAGLLNAGPEDWGNFNNQEGVGKFDLHANGTLILGSRNVTNHDNDYVSFDVNPGATKIYATLWWGEKESNTHRDIDLYLRKPSGATSASSVSGPSVFEHIVVGSPATGTRDIRIYGYDVPAFKSVTVYYAIAVIY